MVYIKIGMGGIEKCMRGVVMILYEAIVNM